MAGVGARLGLVVLVGIRIAPRWQSVFRSPLFDLDGCLAREIPGLSNLIFLRLCGEIG